MSRVLVLWSGGVESTSLLVRLLSESRHDVFAHFIAMDNPEKRAPLERKAITTLLPLLQDIRPFNFSESSFSICNGEAHGFDYAIQYPIGLFVMKHLRCDSIYRAGCWEDDWDHFSSANETRFERKDTRPGASHVRRAQSLVASLDADIDPKKLAPYLESYALPKAEHVKYLGEFAEFTWSCRRPVAGKPCLRCHACKERAAAFAGTSLIPEIAEAINKGVFK